MTQTLRNNHQIIGRQPPSESDPLQLTTHNLIDKGSHYTGWQTVISSNPAVIDPITLVEASELRLRSDFDSLSRWNFKDVYGAFSVIFFKFPQFFETETELEKMAGIIESQTRLLPCNRNREDALRLLASHHEFCKSHMSVSMGLESLIGWNHYDAILFRRGRYIHQLLNLYDEAVEKMKVAV